ncbi:hypothetical protein [Corynebacterium epidermidicanis]|nr:hypothetical protein [Corynebacterium epidermidicanis]
MIATLILMIAACSRAGSNSSLHPATDEVAYVGVVSLTNSKISKPNRLVRIDKAGNLTTVAEIGNTYFPSVEPVQDGFSVPGTNSIEIFSKSLDKIRSLELKNTDAATETRSTSSPSGSFAAYVFNESDGGQNNPEKNVVVFTNGTSVTEVVNEHYTSALTVCDDGKTRWLENVQDGGTEAQGRSGFVNVVTLENGVVRKDRIPHTFKQLPDGPNKLPCRDSPMYLQSRNAFYTFSEAASGFHLISEIPAPQMPTELSARLSDSDGEKFTVVGTDLTVSQFAIATGEPIFKSQPVEDLRGVVAARIFDSGIHLVSRPKSKKGQHAIQVFDNSSRQLKSESIPLRPIDDTQIGVNPKEGFYMITSIYPVSPM